MGSTYDPFDMSLLLYLLKNFKPEVKEEDDDGERLFDFEFEPEFRAKPVRLSERLREKRKIVDVIFHDPATVVKWGDGTKTVVKCVEGDKYDPEKGLLLAIAKRYFNNDAGFYKQIHTWLEDKKRREEEGEKPKEKKPKVKAKAKSLFDIPVGTAKKVIETPEATITIKQLDPKDTDAIKKILGLPY